MTATCSPTPSSSSAGSLHDTMRRRTPDFGPWPSGPSDEVTLENSRRNQIVNVFNRPLCPRIVISFRALSDAS